VVLKRIVKKNYISPIDLYLDDSNTDLSDSHLIRDYRSSTLRNVFDFVDWMSGICRSGMKVKKPVVFSNLKKTLVF